MAHIGFFICGNNIFIEEVIRHAGNKNLQVLVIKAIFVLFICGKPNKKLLYTHDKTKVIFIFLITDQKKNILNQKKENTTTKSNW